MRKTLISLAAGAALAAAAAPAFAQYYSAGPEQREDQIGAQIDRGVNDGNLSPTQAERLRTELRSIVDLNRRYQYEGMADWQLRDLDSRLSLLSSRLNYDLTMHMNWGY